MPVQLKNNECIVIIVSSVVVVKVARHKLRSRTILIFELYSLKH